MPAENLSENKKHSKLGASIAKRWLSCAASVELCEKAPPKAESKYADEGTKAHEWLEYLILKDILKEKVPVMKRPPLEMENAVQTAINWIEENYDSVMGDELLAETKVDLSDIDPEMFGTTDISIIKPGDTLIVADYKHGVGEVVEVKKNEQLLYYALAMAKRFNWNFKTFKIVIIQPRAEHKDGSIRTYEAGIEELKAFETFLRKGVERVRRGGHKPFAGEHCRWCQAAPICPAFQNRSMEAAAAAFTDSPVVAEEIIEAGIANLPALPSPSDLDPKTIGVILSKAKLLENWISEMRSYAQGLLERGGKVEGFKLVPKQARRKWVNEDANFVLKVFNEFGLQALDVKTPKQFEDSLMPKSKKQGLQFVKENAASISSGLTLVHESDRRQAVDNIKQVFGDEYIEGDESHGKEKSEEKIVDAKKETSGKKGKGRKPKSQEEIAKKIFSKTEVEIDLGF